MRGNAGGCIAAKVLLVAAMWLTPANTQESGAGSPGELVRLPAGTFTMGCVVGDSGCETWELPRHQVTLSRNVWMSRTEITVAAYRRFVSATGFRTRAQETGRGRDWNATSGEWEWMAGLTFERPFADGSPLEEQWPAVQIAWHDADAYCRWAGGRLPTEAEWEYGARGGRDGLKFPWGDAPIPRDAGRDHANGPDERTLQRFPRWDVFTGYDDGFARLAPVVRFAANGFGLHDMAGNAWEWVADWFGDDYYRHSPAVDPKGPARGSARVVRGGAWGYAPKQHRNSERGYADPDFRTATFGFRCVFDRPPW